ncbi:hypothetical protein ACLFKT_18740 [Paraburkholderia sp. BR14261]
MIERDFLASTGLQGGNGLSTTVNGEVHLSMAGVLLVALGAMHDKDETDNCREKATALVEKLLSGARRRGFGKADILLTLVAGGERSPRVVELARQAMNGATRDEMVAAFVA